MKDDNKEIQPADLVELDFLEKVVARLPEDVRVLEVLGDLYTRVGRYEDGLNVDRTLSRLDPENMTVWYNLGCSLALVNKRDAALKALQRSVELGYRDREWMSADSDLQSLRGEKEFKSLLKRLSTFSSKETHE